MNNEDLMREVSRREASIKKIDKEIAELKELLINASETNKKGIESRIAAREARKVAEIGSIRVIYSGMLTELNKEKDYLTDQLKSLDKDSDEYANKLLERNDINREIEQINAKLNIYQESNSRKVVAVKDFTDEKEETTDNNKSNRGLVGVALTLLGIAALGCAYYAGRNNTTANIGRSNCAPAEANSSSLTVKNKNGELVELSTPALTPVPFDACGNFTEVTDAKQLNARANWYFQNYGLNKSITAEQLTDALCIFNGELPIDGKFENEDLMLTNNRVANAIIFANSTFDDVKKGTRKFVPISPLFKDGSYIQGCANECDVIMKQLIYAMNAHDDVAFEKYAKEFGALLRDQYYLVSNSDEHKGVRGIVPSTEAIMLYCLEYAEYTGNIMEYGIERKIDICFPFCIDHESGEWVNVSLANFMATLDMVPMNEWDAVLRRAGLTTKDIEALGNGSVEDSMPVVLVRESKQHFQEKKQELSSQKKLTLG